MQLTTDSGRVAFLCFLTELPGFLAVFLAFFFVNFFIFEFFLVPLTLAEWLFCVF